MSYGANFTDIDKKATGWLDIKSQTTPVGVESAFLEHKLAIEQALEKLIKVVGTPEMHVNIGISGHCNPDHNKGKGWGPEYLSIHINAVQPEVKEESEVLPFMELIQ